MMFTIFDILENIMEVTKVVDKLVNSPFLGCHLAKKESTHSIWKIH